MSSSQQMEDLSDVDEHSVTSRASTNTLLVNDVASIPKVSLASQRIQVSSVANSMKRHFAIFSRDYWKDDNERAIRKDDGSTIPFDEITIDLINSNLVEKFATYMASYAVSFKKPHGLLDSDTCIQYYSSFKTRLEEKFSDHSIPALEGSKHTRNMAGIRKIKADWRGKIRVGDDKKNEAASEKEMEAFATACYWDGNLQSAEFIHLFNSMVCNCGRASEVHYKINIDFDIFSVMT